MDMDIDATRKRWIEIRMLVIEDSHKQISVLMAVFRAAMRDADHELVQYERECRAAAYARDRRAIPISPGTLQANTHYYYVDPKFLKAAIVRADRMHELVMRQYEILRDAQRWLKKITKMSDTTVRRYVRRGAAQFE